MASASLRADPQAGPLPSGGDSDSQEKRSRPEFCYDSGVMSTEFGHGAKNPNRSRAPVIFPPSALAPPFVREP